MRTFTIKLLIQTLVFRTKEKYLGQFGFRYCTDPAKKDNLKVTKQ